MFGTHLPKNLDKPEVSIFNVCSVAEGKVIKLLDKHEQGIIDYTKNSWIRTYPKGTRVDSSNYDPFPGIKKIYLFFYNRINYRSLNSSSKFLNSRRFTILLSSKILRKRRHLLRFPFKTGVDAT